MKIAILFAPLALISFAQAVNTSFDTVYDNRAGSIATVACSDGQNGLLTRGFTTFGSLPTFPNIGGAPAIKSWNSPACGTCWKLTFINSKGVSKSINITAIDVATPDFNIALAAMNTLTGGQAQQLGRVPITATQIPASSCGL